MGCKAKFSFFWHPEFKESHGLWNLDQMGRRCDITIIKLTGIVVSKYDPAVFGMVEISVFRKMFGKF